MDLAEGSKDAKKKTGWRWRPTISVDGWRCPAGGPGTCIHCAALPATRRKAHGPGQVGAALSSPQGQDGRRNQQGPESVTSIFRYRLSVRNHPPPPSLGLSRNPLHRRHPPAASPLCPRSARRCGCRQSRALQFSRPHPVSKSTRFASDDAPLSPPPPPQAHPRQSPTVVPRTPARHHTQARLASPTTLTPLLFPHSAPTRTTPLASNIEAAAPKILDDNHDDTKRPRAPRRPSPPDDDDAPRLDVGFSMLPCRVAPAPSERRNISVPSGGKQLGSRATSMQPP